MNDHVSVGKTGFRLFVAHSLKDSSEVRLQLNCTEKCLTVLIKALQRFDGVLQTLEITQLTKVSWSTDWCLFGTFYC
jgi:hypothetical protein